LLAAGTALAAPAAAARHRRSRPAVFVLRGHGWGHGVGMGQWGAEGLARHGWSYREILTHYYPGTALARAGAASVRVLLADGVQRVPVSSARSLRLVDARNRSWTLRRGRYVLAVTLRVRVHGKIVRLRPPVRVLPGAAPLAYDGLAYRGSLVVRRDGRGLAVVNDVPLEYYLRGVVPWEMPFRWHAQALEAQAVAARSYALRNRHPSQSFDLFADARDQVYGGIRAERPSTSAAVAATAGEVLTWHGQIAQTYYCSTSGGRTVAVADAIPGARQVPYLVAVPDPYDTISPKHSWGPLRFTARTLARRLGLPQLRRLRLLFNSSGRVDAVEAIWHGGAARISGRDVERRLSLPSTWFWIPGQRPPPIDLGPLRRPVLAAAGAARGGWPRSERGFTLVLASVPTTAGAAVAEAIARRASAAGVPAVGVLRSDDFSSLRRGFYVVFSGRYGSSAAADAAWHRVAAAYPQAYPRRVAG
jgi:stage II sporulation protein D